MQILIAEDNASSRLILEATLRKWDYEVVSTCDGREAWEILQKPDAPQMAILDWMMPEMDGIEVCRLVRSHPGHEHFYIIMLTTRDTPEDIAEALGAGADDYVAKPPNRKELQARIQVGQRVLELQTALARRVQELEAALKREKQLQGLLPICSYCKKIRDDQNYWQKVEQYIEAHADVAFSHSICPECYEGIVKPELEAFQSKRASQRRQDKQQGEGT